MLALTGFVLAVGAMSMSCPAGATTTTFTNPTSCSASVQNGVCIATVSADYGSSSVTFTMTVGKATDPTTDPNWLNETQTKVSWNIATASSTTPTYVAEADSSSNTPGTYNGVVSSVGSGGSLTKACDHSTGVTASFSVPNNQYTLSFPPSCLGSPASFTVQALMSYVPGSGSTLETAAAPGTPQSFSSCCSVTLDPSSTASTTTTTSSTTTMSSTTTTTTSSTTTTSAPVTSPATATLTSAGNSASGPSSASAPSLAGTGAGRGYPLLLALAAVLVGFGGLGRRVLRRRKAAHGGQ